MDMGDVAVSPDVAGRLESALADICAMLWPQDCQTCGTPLADEPPSLWVDEQPPFATASLHHEKCRESAWNDADPVLVHPNSVTWTSRAWMNTALTFAGRPGPYPFALLNPSLERIPLGQSAGGWEPGTDPTFKDAGMQFLGDSGAGRPEPQVAAVLKSDSVAITLSKSPFAKSYVVPVDESFACTAQEFGGFVFAVTHAVNPAEPLTELDVAELIIERKVLLTWVRLA
jgi:hypothetical protein